MTKARLSKIFTFALILVFSLVQSQDVYKKIIHNTDPQAKCLDGSPGALYMHEGTEKDKFLIFFIGGGYCGEYKLADTLQSCYQRSKTMFGSSNLWPDTIDEKFGAQGFLSVNDTLYRNWTKVLIAYCDGAMHQGGSEIPFEYKGTYLYFRGGRIVRSHFKWLIGQYGLDKASKIMLTGGSAGGIAAFMWGNYLQEQVKNPNSVYIVPDSGIFVDYPTFNDNIYLVSTQIQNVMKFAHLSQKTPIPECNANFPGNEWKCLFLAQAGDYLKGKYLFINSQYDSWAIPYLLEMNCITKGKSEGGTFTNCSSKEMFYIQMYRQRYLQLVDQKVTSRKRGIWSISCSNHVYTSKDKFYDIDSERIPANVGMTVRDAIEQFVFHDKFISVVDNTTWPHNQPCAY